jgi:hypothetical protein
VHGVVAGHDMTIAAAQREGQFPRRAAPDGGGEGGRSAKAPVEVGDEGRPVGLGRLDRRSTRPLACGEWAAR